MFRKPSKNKSASKPLHDLTKVLSAEELLSDPKRRALLESLRTNTKMEDNRYQSLCLQLVSNLTQYYQALPETATRLYSQPGGLMDHALNRTDAALILFHEAIIPADTLELTEEQKLWQYALYSAALLKGLGKVAADFEVELYDQHGNALKNWNPLLETLTTFAHYYQFEFTPVENKALRRYLNVWLARQVMPIQGFNWIAANPEVLLVWLALLNEDEGDAGTLGSLLIRAEAIAVQRHLSEMFALANALGGRGGRGTFMARSNMDGFPSKEQMIGIEFLQWLQDGLAAGRIQFNEAPLLAVPGGVLMCRELFEWFRREHPEYLNWVAIQKGLISLGLHSGSTADPESKFENTQTHETHSGLLLSDYAVALPDQVHLSVQGKKETASALSVIHNADYLSQAMRSQAVVASATVQQLNSSGQWQQVAAVPGNQAGVRSRG